MGPYNRTNLKMTTQQFGCVELAWHPVARCRLQVGGPKRHPKPFHVVCGVGIVTVKVSSLNARLQIFHRKEAINTHWHTTHHN